MTLTEKIRAHMFICADIDTCYDQQHFLDVIAFCDQFEQLQTEVGNLKELNSNARIMQLEKAIREALEWIEIKHRPPLHFSQVGIGMPDGAMVNIRLHALADLYFALRGKYAQPRHGQLRTLSQFSHCGVMR